jgi:hypothetical protein
MRCVSARRHKADGIVPAGGAVVRQLRLAGPADFANGVGLRTPLAESILDVGVDSDYVLLAGVQRR